MKTTREQCIEAIDYFFTEGFIDELGTDKRYYAGVKLPSLVDREDQSYVEEAYGVDLQQQAMFSFLRKEFTKKDLVPEVGDIIEWDKAYFEIDSFVDNQIVGGKDPDYSISTGTTDFGNSHSIILSTHISGVERLNLIPLRGGRYPSTTKITDGTANLLG